MKIHSAMTQGVDRVTMRLILIFFLNSLVFLQHAVVGWWVSFYGALLGSFWPKVMVMHWAAQGYNNNT